MESKNPPDAAHNNMEIASGYLDIKVPAGSRGRRTLKAWRRRWIEVRKSSDKVILRVYISDTAQSKEEPELYKREITPKQAVVFRSQSKTHMYAFTVAEGTEMILHFSAPNETESQTWMTNIRNLLWPPSEVLMLEKVLSGVHEVSIIDNEFSQRADLLGSYGYLKVTNTKVILVHPHTEHVIQEWYLNSLCRFQLLPTSQKEDKNRIFSIETGSESPTGKGILYFYSKEALEILQSIGSTIQKILEKRKKQAKTVTEREQYHKDLEDLEVCLRVPEQNNADEKEEHYQVPRKEIRSVLDIPNFTFNKPLGNSSSELQLRTKTSSTISQRHSCPEMKNTQVAEKLSRLSLHIAEELAAYPELVNERIACSQTQNNKDLPSTELPENKDIHDEKLYESIPASNEFVTETSEEIVSNLDGDLNPRVLNEEVSGENKCSNQNETLKTIQNEEERDQ